MVFAIWNRRTLLEKILIVLVVLLTSGTTMLAVSQLKANDRTQLFSLRLLDQELQLSIRSILNSNHIPYEQSAEGNFKLENHSDRDFVLEKISGDVTLKAKVESAIGGGSYESPTADSPSVRTRKFRINNTDVILNFDDSGRLASTSLTDGHVVLIANVSDGSILSYAVASRNFSSIANFGPDGKLVSSIFDLPSGNFALSQDPSLGVLQYQRRGPQTLGKDVMLNDIGLSAKSVFH